MISPACMALVIVVIALQRVLSPKLPMRLLVFGLVGDGIIIFVYLLLAINGWTIAK